MDLSVRSWTADGRAEARLDHQEPIHFAQALVGGDIVTLADDGVHLWRGGELRRSWPLCSPRSVTTLTDGKLALAALKNPTIYVADPAQEALREQIGHAGPVHGLASSRDHSTLMSWSTDETVRLWRSDSLGLAAEQVRLMGR